MKKITQITFINLLFILVSITPLFAQTTDVLTGINRPKYLLLDGNDLYFSKTNGGVSKLDITDSNPTEEVVYANLNGTSGIAKNGNDLYISESWDNKIIKIDITANPIVEVEVASSASIDAPEDLLLNGNFLYLVENYEFGNQQVSKVDITGTFPATPTLVTSDVSAPLGIALSGNDLYINDYTGGEISKLDITSTLPTTTTDVVTGLSFPSEMTINGNELYFSQDDKVYRIPDISASTPTVETLLSGLGDPYGLAISGTTLFIAEYSANKISKVDLNTLSVDSFDIDSDDESDVSLYPNPTNQSIQLSGLTQARSYEIYNTLGAELGAGEVADKQKIDVSYLSKGMYFLVIDGPSEPLKFVVN